MMGFAEAPLLLGQSASEVLQPFYTGLLEGLGRMIPTYLIVIIMALGALRAFKRLQTLGANALMLYWDRHEHGARLALEPVRQGSLSEFLPASSRTRAIVGEVLRRRRGGVGRRTLVLLGWVLLFPIYLAIFIVRFLRRRRRGPIVDIVAFTSEEWEFVREAVSLRLKPLFGREYIEHANGKKVPMVKHYCVIRRCKNSFLGTAELQLIVMPEWHVQQMLADNGVWRKVKDLSGGDSDELVQIANVIAAEMEQRAKGLLPYGEPFAVGSVKFPVSTTG